MKKLKALFWKYKEPILYVFFGGLTTVVNYIVYFSCTAGLKLGWSAATVLAWVGAVCCGAAFVSRYGVGNTETAAGCSAYEHLRVCFLARRRIRGKNGCTGYCHCRQLCIRKMVRFSEEKTKRRIKIHFACKIIQLGV